MRWCVLVLPVAIILCKEEEGGIFNQTVFHKKIGNGEKDFQYEENLTAHFNTIIHLIRQIIWHGQESIKNSEFVIALLTNTNCFRDKQITSLISLIKRIDSTHLLCHQIALPFNDYEVKFIRSNHPVVTVMLLPWHTTELMLERLARHGVDKSFYVTIGISQSNIDYVKKVNMYMKIINIPVNSAVHAGCNMASLPKIPLLKRSNDSSSHLNKQEQHYEHKKVFICKSIQSRTLRITTVQYQRNHIFNMPSVISDPTQVNACPPRSLPCRKIQKMNNTDVWRWFCCRGYLVDYLEAIFDDLRITNIEIYFVADGSWGSYSNGKWTGMVNDVSVFYDNDINILCAL